MPASAKIPGLLLSNDTCSAILIAPRNHYHHAQCKPKTDVERQQPHKNAQSLVFHTAKLLGHAFTEGMEATLLLSELDCTLRWKVVLFDHIMAEMRGSGAVVLGSNLLTCEMRQEIPTHLPLSKVWKSTITKLVVSAALGPDNLGSLRPTALSLSDARSNGVASTVSQKYPFTALLSINLIHDFRRKYGAFKELLHMLPKEIPPHPDDSVGGDSDVANQHKNTEDRLLESRYVAQLIMFKSVSAIALVQRKMASMYRSLKNASALPLLPLTPLPYMITDDKIIVRTK